jgi:DNA-binding NtrC family response regulator
VTSPCVIEKGKVGFNQCKENAEVQTSLKRFSEECIELENLKCDMAELVQILNTAVRQSVREVILMDINMLLTRIVSLIDFVKKKSEIEKPWTEVVIRGHKKSPYVNHATAHPIPVVVNRYELLSNMNE